MSGPSPCVRGLVPGEEALLGSGENLRDEAIWEALGQWGCTLERGHGTLVLSFLCLWLGVELFFSAICS